MGELVHDFELEEEEEECRQSLYAFDVDRFRMTASPCVYMCNCDDDDESVWMWHKWEYLI